MPNEFFGPFPLYQLTSFNRQIVPWHEHKNGLLPHFSFCLSDITINYAVCHSVIEPEDRRFNGTERTTNGW